MTHFNRDIIRTKSSIKMVLVLPHLKVCKPLGFYVLNKNALINSYFLLSLSIYREQQKHFQALVEQKFNEWLVKTGNRHQLDSLVPPSDGTKQVAG